LKARAEGYDVSHAHLRYIKPFPKNLGEVLYNFEHVLIPEMNTGQLIKMIRDKFLIPAEGLNKIQGMPFAAEEIYTKIVEKLK
jgi:2-oxoglutarate/2-oxoacid ferredoxin oxidoreductase subunit alpha